MRHRKRKNKERYFEGIKRPYFKLLRINILLTILICLPLINKAWSQGDTLVVEGTVYDKKTSTPLPFATVYNSRNKTGTITNDQGHFLLEGANANDILKISFVGYDKLMIPAGETALKDSIYLSPGKELLNEVIVMADDSYLYELIAGARKTGTLKPLEAKTYFELESFANDQQVELVESYYNGTYTGYDLKALSIKAGRLGLSGFQRRLFVSLETSKALILHKLLKHDDYFPGSPLECNKRKLKRQFQLRLASKYQDEDNGTTYVINYNAKDTSLCLFEGQIWIDSSSHNLHKITYQINDACNHPFFAYFDLNRIDIEITKTFQPVNGQMYPQSIDFGYRMYYKQRADENVFGKDSTIVISTNAVIYAYDYENKFILPFFDFTESAQGDYRKINAIPYNSFFWHNCSDFRINTNRESNEEFFRQNAALTNHTLFTSDFMINSDYKGFFESPYRFWSEERIFFKENLKDSISYDGTGAIPTTLYNLEAQLFMDVNTSFDSINVITATIFDPFKSYYHLPLNSVSTTFINLYFDIVEIKRLELEEEIKNSSHSLSEILSLHEAKVAETRDLTQTFFKEVDRCTNEKATLKWNQYVKENLGIDNVSIFRTFETQY